VYCPVSACLQPLAEQANNMLSTIEPWQLAAGSACATLLLLLLLQVSGSMLLSCMHATHTQPPAQQGLHTNTRTHAPCILAWLLADAAPLHRGHAQAGPGAVGVQLPALGAHHPQHPGI
jgi:hypothetical protein